MTQMPTVEPSDSPQLVSVPRPEAPFYLPVGDETEIFEAAWQNGLGIMLKGPTGCGKTRLVEHMAHRFGVPLSTVSCHEDITTADLLGRYVLAGGDTVWVDGPLTRAVREGGICYLDEIVEARQDSIVAIHPLVDHRRELCIERLGGIRIPAAEGFCIAISYNPGYQSILKDLKMSTRQRMISIELGFPPPDIEHAIVMHEAQVDTTLANDLVSLGQAIRRLEDSDLKEVASTRTLIAAAKLTRSGLPLRTAAAAAITGPLTDDHTLQHGLHTIIDTYLPATAR
jgi:nitric oxide reductase NorQ protein